MLNAFVFPGSTPLGANPSTFTLYSNDPNLKQPLGENWTQSGSAGSATAPFYTFNTSSTTSQAVQGSATFNYLLTSELAKLKPTVLAYFAANPTATQYTSPVIPFSDQEAFSAHETLGFFSDLNLAFGTVVFNGTYQVTVRQSDLTVTNLTYDGTFNDLFNFYFYATDHVIPLNRPASEVQAGYPTLGSGGQVYESQVQFSGTDTSYSFIYTF
ncbi:MAG: hypothetical protein LV479_03530 [Methylacidiphilales bacterium]|nr:hypothetical protein [Candidatus Methylacidiphilales bacterium]